jgi:hypothetical protein
MALVQGSGRTLYRLTLMHGPCAGKWQKLIPIDADAWPLCREVAETYSQSDQGVLGIVLECEVDAVNRGADISFLSFYAGESEVVFPPLSMLEVVGTPHIGVCRICLCVCV